MLRDLPLPAGRTPAGVELRPQTPDDIPALGALYWDSYPKGVAAVDPEDAVEEMEGVFDGEYGEPLESASLVAVDATDGIIGCIQTVTGAPWEGTPQGAFVIELFVHPDHRRRGLGTALLLAAAAAAEAAGHDNLALNAQEQTSPEAIHLYRRLGFAELPLATAASTAVKAGAERQNGDA